jgi:hypothetical protein
MPTSTILATERVPIDADCTGERWTTSDVPTLARLIAIIAMGQAQYAGHILTTLAPAKPKINIAELRKEARIKLTVENPVKTPRGGYPLWQRDGFIFECISWLAARQAYPGVLLKAPHVSATWFKGYMAATNAGRVGRVIQRVVANCAGEPIRRSFLRRSGATSFDIHEIFLWPSPKISQYFIIATLRCPLVPNQNPSRLKELVHVLRWRMRI